MSRQSNSRSSITGRFKFAPDIESDIAKAEKDVSLLRGSIVTLKQGASLGKDLAAQAGYDSNERNRITDLLRKTKDFSEECQTLRQDIRVAKESVRQVELNSLAGLDSDGDGEARKRATSKLVEFLAESPDIQTLLAHMPPAMNTSIQGVLAQGPNPSEDVVALQTLLETRNKKITDLEAMCRHHEREAQRAMQDLRRAQEHHENNKSALKRKIANPDGKDWKNEYLAESKFRNLKLDMQAEIDSQKKQIDSFKAANTNLKRTANDVEFQLRETQSELRKAKREHANETRMAENDLRVFENAVQAKRQVFADQNRRINELEKALTNKYNIITKRDDVIRTRDQEIQSLNEIISRQRKALVEKNLKIKKLEKASNHKDNIITKRDGIDKTQVQEAANSPPLSSSTNLSSNLELVTKGVLVDSTKTSLASARWQPWKICSWSDQTSLKIARIDRSPEAIAIQILVALDGRSVEAVELLSLLDSLQTSLRDSSSMASSMIPMLVRAFTTVGAGVHFMHRLVMCQIANLLAPTDEALCHFTEALDTIDPRINSLVNALKICTSESLVFQDSITVASLTLVGLHRRPRGILAVHLVNKEICWVGLDHINKSFDTIKLLYMGQSIDIPVDSIEITGWATIHM